MCIWAYSRWVECQKPGSIHLDPSPQGRKWVKACYNSNARKNCATTGISEEPFELLTGPCPQYHQQEWYREHYPHLKYNDLCRKRTPPPTQTPTLPRVIVSLKQSSINSENPPSSTPSGLKRYHEGYSSLKATKMLTRTQTLTILFLRIPRYQNTYAQGHCEGYGDGTINPAQLQLHQDEAPRDASEEYEEHQPEASSSKARAKNRVKVPRTIERTLEVVVVVAAAPAVAKADATKNQSDENIDCK
jgi:hypothetical protein